MRLASSKAAFNLETEGPGLFALVMVIAGIAARVSSIRNCNLLVIQIAVGTEGGSVLVKVVRVERLTWGEGVKTLADGDFLIGEVLCPGIVGAELGVKWSWEELAAHPVLGRVDGLTTTIGSSSPRCRSGASAGA